MCFFFLKSHLLKVLVAVDVLLIVGVLQLVGFYVLPQGLDDAGAGLSVDAEQASQARVQLKLRRLHRQYNPNVTSNILRTFPGICCQV